MKDETNFDVFEAMTRPRRTYQSNIAVHNVRLIGIRPDENGYTLMTVEHAGITREILSARKWNESNTPDLDVGRVGYVVSAFAYSEELSQGLPVGACYFRAYIDQSLRRLPEIDSNFLPEHNPNHSRVLNVIGWYCDSSPEGFLAPVGIIPGQNGSFFSDRTESVSLRVPPEFLRVCRSVQMAPEKLLRSFIGDLSGIQNFLGYPRADGYSSNGSDERDYAAAWLERAHGMNFVDVDELEEREEEAAEKLDQREDFADFLAEFEEHGGKADDLFAAVQELVNKQASEEGST